MMRGDKTPPLGAGTFDADASGHAELEVRDIPVDTPVSGFSVTLESRGGSTAPSGKVLLQGKA